MWVISGCIGNDGKGWSLQDYDRVYRFNYVKCMDCSALADAAAEHSKSLAVCGSLSQHVPACSELPPIIISVTMDVIDVIAAKYTCVKSAQMRRGGS